MKFDLIYYRNDIPKLIDNWEIFTEYWIEEEIKNIFIDFDEINSAVLPEPLRRFYQMGLNQLLESGQDRILSLDQLEITDNKLMFAAENQAVWLCHTEIHGYNPPIWIEDEDGTTKLNDSLAEFLITLSLQEMVMSSKKSISHLNLLDKLKNEKPNVLQKIWSGSTPWKFKDENWRILNFWIYKDEYLIMQSDSSEEAICASKNDKYLDFQSINQPDPASPLGSQAKQRQRTGALPGNSLEHVNAAEFGAGDQGAVNHREAQDAAGKGHSLHFFSAQGVVGDDAAVGG